VDVVFFGNVGNYTTQALFPNPGFDTLRDFAFIGRVTLGPLAIAVPADFPARSLQELLGHASLGSTQIYTRVDAASLLENYRNAHPRS
jgi:tripartite-type tricarboxylate transporter receptor subunit TctC